MFRGVGSNCHAMQFPVTPGKVLHILLIRTIIVEPAPLPEQPDELFRAGGDYLTAIQQMISLYHIVRIG